MLASFNADRGGLVELVHTQVSSRRPTYRSQVLTVYSLKASLIFFHPIFSDVFSYNATRCTSRLLDS